jgi:hypothetical protein
MCESSLVDWALQELEPMLQSRSRTGEMLQGVLSHVIAEYNFNKLCRSLLPLLPEEDLLGFANGLCLGSPKDIRSLEATQVFSMLLCLRTLHPVPPTMELFLLGSY